MKQAKVGLCKHCGKAIHLSDISEMWFHDYNLMTFCAGAAFLAGTRVDSSKAEPQLTS